MDSDICVERRELRKRLRSILEDTHILKTTLETEDDGRKYNYIRSQLNKEEKNIQHVREMTLDALVLKELAHALHQQGVKLEDYSIKLNIPQLFYHLSYKYSDEENNNNQNTFSWSSFGRDVGVYFRSVPHLETMNGPVFREPKVRKIAERKGKKTELAPTTKAAEVTHEEEADHTEEASKRRLQSLLSTLSKLSQPEHISTSSNESIMNQPIDMISLLVDSQSVVQTIENFFDFSFIVKKKSAIIQENKDTHLPEILVTGNIDSVDTIQKQKVFSLNVKQLKKLMTMIDHVNQTNESSQSFTHRSSSQSDHTMTQGLLHRDSDMYEAKTVWDQANILARNNATKIQKATNHSQQRSSNSNLIHSPLKNYDDDSDTEELVTQSQMIRGKKRKAPMK